MMGGNPITESLEEVFKDPLIEAVSGGIAGSIGRAFGMEDTRLLEIVASTLAESARETATNVRTDIINKRVTNKLDADLKTAFDVENKIAAAKANPTAVNIDAAKTAIQMCKKAAKSIPAQMKELKIKDFKALDKDPDTYAAVVKGAIVDGKKPSLLAKPMFTRITSGAILTNTLQIASNKENSYQDKLSQIAHEKKADLAGTFRKIADNKKPKPSKKMFVELARAINMHSPMYGLSLMDPKSLSDAGIYPMGAPGFGQKSNDNTKASKKAKQQITISSYLSGVKTKEFVIPPLNDPSRVTKEHFNHDFLKLIWKQGHYDGKYIFGFIYRWTDTRSGDFIDGRTEQRGVRNSLYNPVAPISKRFVFYLDKATNYVIFGELSKRSIEYRMREVYEAAGGESNHDKAVRAIIRTFKLEILEVVLISNNYEQDKSNIENTETWWINHDKADPNLGTCLNQKEGGAGPHVKEEHSVYALIEFHDTIKYLITQGFSVPRIARYLKLSESQTRRLIKLCCNGKTFEQAAQVLINERIDLLIKEGYIYPKNFEPYFRGMDSNEIFSFLSKYKTEYLKAIISSEIALGYITYEQIADRLGVKDDAQLVGRFVRTNMRGVEERMILYIKPLARKQILHSKNALDLLVRLGLDTAIMHKLDGLVYDMRTRVRAQNAIDKKIAELFPEFDNYDKARYYYHNKYLGAI